MQFGWINAVNAGFVIALIAISVIGQKKSGLPAMSSRNLFLNTLEQIGRYACMVLMIVPLLPKFEFGFQSVGAMAAWLIVSALLLAEYALLWTQTGKGGNVFYSLAIVPAVLFLFCGILLRHPALIAAAVLFGVSHTLIVRETLQTKTD